MDNEQLATGSLTMKALVLTAVGHLELAEVPLPGLHELEALVRVKAAGVCGSDLHGYTGQSGRRTPPLIMGHEATGEVVMVGAAVENLPVGSRVAVQPVAFCGRCWHCCAGRRNLCDNRSLMGMNAAGAYAEYVTWPAANLFPLPDTLSYASGALAEPLAVAIHAVSLAPVHANDTAFIAGAGPIGLLTLGVLRHRGLRRIAVSDTSQVRLAAARSLGAHTLINPTRQDARAAVDDMTAGLGVDLAFEAVGLSATAQQSLAVTRHKGTVVWIGNNQRLIEIDMQAVVTRELTILGSYAMTDADFQRALSLLADNVIDTRQLINRRATLVEGPHLFEELLAAPETIKCVINFGD